LLLIDVTTEIEGTIQLINKYSPLVKKDGRLIAAFKSRMEEDVLSRVLSMLTPDLYVDVETIVLESSRQEFHLIANRQ